MIRAVRKRFLLLTVLLAIGAGVIGLGFGLHQSSAAVQDVELFTSAVTPAVVSHIAETYVEPSRVSPASQLEAALIALEKAVPEVLVDWKKGEPELTLQVGKVTRHVTVPPLNSIDDLVPVLKQVYRIVQKHLVSELETPRIEYAAMNGLLQSLDPHSVLLSPEVNKEFRLSAHGSFGGLGIVIGIRDGELTVIAPLEGTPAFRAGIKSKDRIVQIEEESTVNMDLIEAVGKLRGEPGTGVTISIMREGLSEAKEVKIVRELIRIHSIESYALGDGIGYVTVKNFQENTLRDLNEALRAFQKEGGLKGLVLDLRNNPGGLFDQAVAVADKFIGEGTIVITVGANNTFRKPSYARGWRSETDLPMVALINHGSASASEIVSGALKYRNRAILIGTQTFGKGSVQQIFDLPDGSALKLSIAQYLLPGERSIQSVGVTPDLVLKPVELPSDEKDKEVRFESFLNGNKERDLEHSFSEWASEADKPLFRLAYLKEREAEGGREVMELTSQEKAERVKKDFAAQLAKRILLKAPSASRQALLETSADVVPAVAEQEEARIVTALKKFSIDWSRPKADLLATAQKAASTELASELVFKPDHAQAGQDVTMTLAVTNQGSRPIHQVRAVTEAEVPIFNNREFLLGRIGPRETKRWSLDLTLPKNLTARSEKVTAKVQDSQGAIGKAEGVVVLEPLDRPRFAFRYKLFDDGRYGSKGNGDGLPQDGETMVLRMTVKNEGKGESKKSVAALKLEKGLGGVFIEVGRGTLEELASGDSRPVDFVFRIQPDFAAGSLPVDLSVVDTVLRDGLAARVDLAKPQAASEFNPPEVVFLGGGPPLTATGEKFTLRGRASDDGKLASVIVFANDRKALYMAGPSEGSRSMDFSADIELKEGVNQVLVIAQDDQKLETRHVVVVRREPMPALARSGSERPVAGQ